MNEQTSGAPQFRIAPRLHLLYRKGSETLIAGEDFTSWVEDSVESELLECLSNPPEQMDPLLPLATNLVSDQIRTALEGILARDLVQPGISTCTTQDAYWDSLGCRPTNVEVAIRTLCPLGSDQIEVAISSNGFVISDRAEFLLATTDDYLRPELAQFASRSKPWLLAKPIGHTIFLGPLFIPGQTACWSCMALRMKPHRWQQIAFVGGDGDFLPPQPSFAATPASLAIAASMIASTVAVWMATGRHPELEGAILSLDTRSMKLHRNLVRRHPDCKICGPLDSKPKGSPLRTYLSPLTGLVSGIHLTDRPVCGFYHAAGYFSAPLPKRGVSRYLKPQHSVGKGLSPEEAEALCIAEGIERYSVLFRGDEPRQRARISEVAALDPARIMLYSNAQYDGREAWNQTHFEKQYVPQRFVPDAKVDWTPVKSLRTGETKYIPTALCYMYYDFAGELDFYRADANGCAAGQSEAHAILSGLLELVERDAVGIWWYNRICRPAIDLASLADPQILEVERAFREAGRSLHVLDISNDLGIPACVAISPRLDGTEPCFGTAAALSVRHAAFKAMSEAAQVCFWAGRGDGPEDLLRWMRETTVCSHSYLCPQGETCDDLPPPISSHSPLTQVTERLFARGIEPYHLDLTRPEIGLPVARVFAPDLCHFWARFAPRRLYEVPVIQGWRSKPLNEHELNPVPCMI